MDIVVVCSWMLGVFMFYLCLIAQLVLPHFDCRFSPNKLLSRMAPETRGHTGSNPPPPPKPDMAHVLRLMLEDREAAHAERQANLATLQHLAQIATNNHNNNGGNGNDEPHSKLRDFQN
jgi:hypothetical protein